MACLDSRLQRGDRARAWANLMAGRGLCLRKRHIVTRRRKAFDVRYSLRLRLLGSAATAAALSLILAACGGGTSGGTNAGNGEGGGDVDELVVAISGDIDNFDPHTAQLVVHSFAVKHTVFSTLVDYDENLELRPDLADDWSVNDDATEFTFHLVEGATFHDGTPVTAEAVAQSLERVGEANSVWAPRVEHVENVDIVSDTELVVHLSQPAANFLDGLTGVAILAPSSFEDAEHTPVGSGPFKFVEWVANEHIVLERNPDYFGTPPSVETLEFRPIPDEQVAFVNLQAGEVDVIVSAGTALVEQAEAASLPVVRPPFSAAMIIAEMGGTTGTLEDVRVRQALAHALDRESVNEIEFNGDGELLDAPLPTGFEAYAAQDAYDFDLDRSQALLQEAGAEDLSLQIEVLSGSGWADSTARVWQENLAKIGVDMKINVSENTVWLDTYVSHDYDIIINNFPPPEPHVFFDLGLRPLLQDGENWYDRPDIDEMIDLAVATSDTDERGQVYADLQAHVMEELPILPVLTMPLASVTAADIQGYQLDPRGFGMFEQVTRG